MALDVGKWLDKPGVDERVTPPIGVIRVLGGFFLKQGFIPDIRFFPKDKFLHYAAKMRWNQEQLDTLVSNGGLIPAVVDINHGPGIYGESGFMFAESAKREYAAMLGQVAQAYDFSEID